MTELLESVATPSRTRHATKIAVVLLDTLPTWQKLNVTAFLASGVAATAGESIGASYQDADGTHYSPMFGQPVMVFAASQARLRRACDRAIARGVTPAIFTESLFATGDDESNRAQVSARTREDLDLVGIAVRADRKVVDKIVDGLPLHR
ncbi:DUF2000 domain-containing protein [Mycolicibacterium sp. 018/SC-01/001]|uniref:DUF2000 domain-containing protein n=1 Tax=Mycolicibacterium sp. 018/SC-01/001 TaxID=2592069 RepID=UPI001180EDA5|nr:DUF2000 domain-containing protein [Mycolicibacterium sp. 018/SC-01/001]TRW88006.1 DUF2000 domain-containing protein [Mycolicibacterium sp. 018/SC-01/001]